LRRPEKAAAAMSSVPDVKPYIKAGARLESDKPHQGVARLWFVRGRVLALLPLGGAPEELSGAGLVC
jgi:hypothetical protein